MEIQLPVQGFVFLKNFVTSSFFPVFLVLIGGIGLQTYNEDVPLLPEKPTGSYLPDPSLKFILIVVLTALVYDVYTVKYQGLYWTRLHIGLRNSLAIIVGILTYFFFSKGEFSCGELLGRIKPPARLVSFGLLTFFVVGLFFWGVSFWKSFTVPLHSIGGISSKYFAIVLLSVVGIPLTEELFFRLYLYSYLRGLTGVVTAILVTSLVFSSFHGISVLTLAIFLGAIFMSLCVELTGSILPPLTLHAGFNFLMYCGGYWIP